MLRDVVLADGDPDKLTPMTNPGSGEVRDKQMALLAEIIAQVNDLFEGELTEGDELVYVNNGLKTKLLESDVLVRQAAMNTKEQFANSPDLNREFMNAVMDLFSAHTAMSTQVLNSDRVQRGVLDILLGPAQLYEALRAKNGP